MIGSEHIDVASIAIWLFWVFFFGLIYYLRREDHRYGYPLENDAGGTKNKRGPQTVVNWENGPGNVNGIFQTIILPEFRAKKDPRLLEYWDMVLKKETERMADRTLDVEVREWTMERRPKLLWQRTQDVLLLGQRNRAIGEMFNIVKSFPYHPDAAGWLDQLETTLVPNAEPVAAPAPSTGTVPPPVPVPSAVPAGTPLPR